MRLAVVQMNSQPDVSVNLSTALTLMKIAVDNGADWLLLPEHFQWAGGLDSDKQKSAESFPDGHCYTACAEFAARHRVYVHAGSLYETIPNDVRIYNTTVVFGRNGEEIARYRKLHLFDITAPDGVGFRESDAVARGEGPVIYTADGIVFGCAICYDVRFPELFQRLVTMGAQVIALPAAFTLQTGKDHWETLIRARAIETQTYFAASGSCGSVERGTRTHWTYGNSMIVDPWGIAVARASDGAGIIYHDIDLELVQRIRKDMPVQDHRVDFL